MKGCGKSDKTFVKVLYDCIRKFGAMDLLISDRSVTRSKIYCACCLSMTDSLNLTTRIRTLLSGCGRMYSGGSITFSITREHPMNAGSLPYSTLHSSRTMSPSNDLDGDALSNGSWAALPTYQCCYDSSSTNPFTTQSMTTNRIPERSWDALQASLRVWDTG